MKTVKIVLCGDDEVGKKALILSATEPVLEDRHTITTGTIVTKFELGGENDPMTMMVWTLHSSKFLPSPVPMLGMYLKDAEGAIIVADATRQKTVKNLECFRKAIISCLGDIPMVYVLNKKDLKDAKALEKVKELARKVAGRRSPVIAAHVNSKRSAAGPFVLLWGLLVKKHAGKPLRPGVLIRKVEPVVRTAPVKKRTGKKKTGRLA